jgi:hypothetical protein
MQERVFLQGWVANRTYGELHQSTWANDKAGDSNKRSNTLTPFGWIFDSMGERPSATTNMIYAAF